LAAGRVTQALRLVDATGTVGIAQDEHPARVAEGRPDGLVIDVMRKATLGLIGSHVLSPLCCRSGPCPAP